MPARQTTKKAVYRIRNWREYNQALVRRGSLTVWVDQQALDAWNYRGPNQRGAQYIYSDAAIQCLMTLRAVYHPPLRGTFSHQGRRGAEGVEASGLAKRAPSPLVGELG